MEEFELLSKMERVEAPSGFEQKVMAQLSLRKRKHLRTRRLGFSLAGACAALAVVVLVLNVAELPQKETQALAKYDKMEESAVLRPAPRWNRLDTIPITESVNYSGEVQNVSRQARTIYILEQVSDRADTKIFY